MPSKAIQIFFLMLILLKVVITLLQGWYEGWTFINICLGIGAIFIVGLMIRIATKRYW